MNGGLSCSLIADRLVPASHRECGEPGLQGYWVLGTGYWGHDPGAAVRMRCPGGEECCPGPPGKAALQDAALVSASCPSAGSPHCLPVGSHTWPRAGRRSRVGGGGAGRRGWAVRLRPRGWAPRDAARGVVGGLRGFSRACASPLSFPERVSLQGRRDLCLEPALTGRQW